jgi:hypothetical protein
MGSPASSSIGREYYREFLGDEGYSTDEELEQDAITSALALSARYLEETSTPTPPKQTRQYYERDRVSANARLMKDYFDENPTYPDPKIFRRRFRMSKRLFLRISGDLENAFTYFKQKADARGMMGFTSIQKCTSALRILAYGNTTDINDEYLKMVEKTTRDSLEYFCQGTLLFF